MTIVLKDLKIILKRGVELKEFDYKSFVDAVGGRTCAGCGVLEGHAYYFMRRDEEIDPAILGKYPQIERVETTGQTIFE